MEGIVEMIEKQIEIWHTINGKWVHIQQFTKDGVRKYYTDGVLVLKSEVREDGTI